MNTTEEAEGAPLKRKIPKFRPVTYRVPSLKALAAVFPDPDVAIQAKLVLHMKHAELVETEGGGKHWRECYNPCPTWELRMAELDRLAETFGVETFALKGGKFVDYLNTGDSYAATICRVGGHYRVSSWGDIAERYETMDLQEAIARNNYRQH
jgi:hypothetical protein